MISIFLFPRLSGLFRVEDFLTPGLLVGALISLNNRTFRYCILPLVYFVYGFIITGVSVVFFELPLQAYLIWGKEFQYILIFMIVINFPKDKVTRNFIHSLIIFMLLVASFSGIYLLVSGVRGYYGVGYFTESSPSLGMLMYFHCLFWSVYFYKVYKNPIYLCSAVLFFILAILVGSRTGQIITIILSFSLLLLHSERKIYILVLSLIFSILVSINSGFIYETLYHINTGNLAIDGGFSRLATILKISETIQGSRIVSWLSVVNQALDTNPIFGCGRGCSHISGSTFSLGMGADNQYTVNFLELGVVGSFLFVLILVVILINFYKDSFVFKLYLPYILAMVTAGMAMEVFQLSKGGSLFWFSTAMMFICQKENFKGVYDTYNHSST